MAIIKRNRGADGPDEESTENLARLEEEAKRLRSVIHELVLLNDLAVSVGIEQDIDSVLDAVVRKAVKAVKAEQGSISLTTHDAGAPLKTLVRQDENSRLGHKYAVVDKVIGWVLLNREPLRIDDFSREKKFTVSDVERSLIRSMLCIPMMVKREIIGVLLMVNKIGGGTFTKEDMRFLNIIASQSGQLITNKQLYQESVREQKEAERARLESEKLQTLNEMKSKFTANVSHEFRTPLTLIMGQSQALLSTIRGPERKKLGIINRNAARLMSLVNELLDLTKIDAGSVRLQVYPGRIVRFVKKIVDEFSPLAERKEIALRFDCPMEEKDCYFDAEKIEKVIYNLLSNAFKFTPKGGNISVGLRITEHTSDPKNGESFLHPQRYLDIEVSDSGIGIPREHLDKVFDRFYQSDYSLSISGEGSGIGLSLVKELVELHHGIVTVSSEPEKGSSFIVKLPVGPEGYDAGEIVETPPRLRQHSNCLRPESCEGGDKDDVVPVLREKGKASRISILVADDNRDIRNYIRDCISGDYAALLCGNGEEALQKAIECIPDLVVSDVMMPGMDGFELCRLLKMDERTSHIPVVLLTARAETEATVEGLDTGADDYLVKPFEPQVLLARIRNLIEQRRRLRERFSRRFIVEPKELAVTSTDERFMQKLMDLLEKHISDIGFGVESLGREMGMSRVQLYRKIKALTDQSASEFIRTIRLRRAAQLLKGHSGTVSEVCYSVGFDSPSYFAGCFKKLFGETPSEYTLSADK